MKAKLLPLVPDKSFFFFPSNKCHTNTFQKDTIKIAGGELTQKADKYLNLQGSFCSKGEEAATAADEEQKLTAQPEPVFPVQVEGYSVRKGFSHAHFSDVSAASAQIWGSQGRVCVQSTRTETAQNNTTQGIFLILKSESNRILSGKHSATFSSHQSRHHVSCTQQGSARGWHEEPPGLGTPG